MGKMKKRGTRRGNGKTSAKKRGTEMEATVLPCVFDRAQDGAGLQRVHAGVPLHGLHLGDLREGSGDGPGGDVEKARVPVSPDSPHRVL